MAGDLIIVAVLAVSFLLISGPLRGGHRGRSDAGDLVAELRAARDAKYLEIRDAEMDLRTGKLSEEDHATVDRTLRGEAIDILHRLDEAEAQAEAEGSVRTEGAVRPPEVSSPS